MPSDQAIENCTKITQQWGGLSGVPGAKTHQKFKSIIESWQEDEQGDPLGGLGSILSKGLESGSVKVVGMSGADGGGILEKLFDKIEIGAPTLYVLSGNRGTGKTEVAKQIGKFLKAEGTLDTGHIVQVSAQDLQDDLPGGTAVRIMAAGYRARGGVLVINDADHLMLDKEFAVGINKLRLDLDGQTDSDLALVYVGGEGFADKAQKLAQSTQQYLMAQRMSDMHEWITDNLATATPEEMMARLMNPATSLSALSGSQADAALNDPVQAIIELGRDTPQGYFPGQHTLQKNYRRYEQINQNFALTMASMLPKLLPAMENGNEGDAKQIMLDHLDDFKSIIEQAYQDYPKDSAQEEQAAQNTFSTLQDVSTSFTAWPSQSIVFDNGFKDYTLGSLLDIALKSLRQRGHDVDTQTGEAVLDLIMELCDGNDTHPANAYLPVTIADYLAQKKQPLTPQDVISANRQDINRLIETKQSDRAGPANLSARPSAHRFG